MPMPKNPNKSTIFTPAIAQMWAKMYCELYKRGVRAARLADDEGLCREYLEQTAQTGVWGEIGDRRLSDNAIDWQVTLNAVARDIACYTPLQNYMTNMGRFGSNYFSVALNIALDWERLGVADYLAYGSKCDLTLLDSAPKVRLTAKELVKIDNGMIQDLTQQMVRDRIITDGESGSKIALSKLHYDKFRIRISQLSRSRMREYFG